MAFNKTLAQRLFRISRITPQNSFQNCRLSSSTAVKSLSSVNPDSEPGDDGVFRRFLHRQPEYQSPASFPEIWSLSGEKLLEKFRGTDIVRDRINLDVLRAPAEEEENAAVGSLTAEDARKLLKLSCLEMVKWKLREIENSCISYDEFVKLCTTTSFGEDHGLEVARLLDQSGTVIVLGNVVFIKPEQVMKAITGLIPEKTVNGNDPRMKEELAEMEKQKVTIDYKAESLVRKELWRGLGFLVIQTAAFMRLTFWELTWDVMEPICFYVTSMYFMAGYAFFLQTSKEPSFEGFFQGRFIAKQRKLMKLHNFDIDKYNQLRKACYGDAFRELEGSASFPPKFGDFHNHAVR